MQFTSFVETNSQILLVIVIEIYVENTYRIPLVRIQSIELYCAQTNLKLFANTIVIMEILVFKM